MLSRSRQLSAGYLPSLLVKSSPAKISSQAKLKSKSPLYQHTSTSLHEYSHNMLPWESSEGHLSRRKSHGGGCAKTHTIAF